jgi:hypothetical protein
MFKSKEARTVVLVFILLVVVMCVGAFSAVHADDQVRKTAFDKVDLQRVHDDDAGVTCWILYAPSDSTMRSDSYGISCLPNTVIKPEAIDK